MSQPSLLTSWHTVQTCLQSFQRLLSSQNTLRTPHFFKKYSYKTGKEQRRTFSLDSSGLNLEWAGTGAFSRRGSVPITDITAIKEGNEAFECLKRRVNIRLDPADLCFSLTTPFTTLYLVSDTKETRDAWLAALRTLQEEHNADELLTQSNEKLQQELSDLVEEKQRLTGKLKNLTLEMEQKQTENEYLKTILAEYEEKVKELEGNTVKQELEDYYNSLLVQKDLEIGNKNTAIQALTEELKAQDAKNSGIVLKMEQQLVDLEARLRQSESDYSEYKETMKTRLVEGIDAQAGQYRHANKMLTAYVAHLKKGMEEMEKECALWKSTVYHFAVVGYVEEKGPEMMQVKEVLRYALDHVERHYSSVSTQRELVDLLSQTRSIRSRQSLNWSEFKS